MQRGLELGGRYRLDGLLGRGGMGEVWRAMDLRLRRPVAVKILPLSAGSEKDAVVRFRREAEAAAALNHPGITIVHDIDEHQDEGERSLFLVMELLIGRDLRSLLSSHPDGLPIEQVTDLATQIAEALSAAHGKGVVHRDIKPANLFLLDTGRTKICDFGIARLVDATRITTTGSTAGTPLYMAPEQIKGAQVDHRTDLYAFGCVLYELLTGTTWVDTSTNTAAILYQHIDQRPAPPKSSRPEIPDHLDSLVLELLAKQPDDRPQDATTVAVRLRRPPDEPRQAPGSASPTLAAGERRDSPIPDQDSPTFVPPTPPPAPPASRPGDDGPALPRRFERRTVVIGGLGAAAAALAGAVWLLHDTASPPPPTLLAALKGHSGEVESVAFSPDGKTLATASEDGTARLWDIATRRTTAVLDGRPHSSNSVAFSPDGTTLATGSDGRLWNVATGYATATLKGQATPPWSVAFSPDGRTLATGSDIVQLWNVTSGHTIAVLGHHSSDPMAFSPDGKTLATGSADNTARLWDVATRHTTATLKGHTGSVTAMAFRPDGKALATGSGSGDYSVRLWNTATGRTTAIITGDNRVNAVAFSPDGKTLAIGSDGGSARLWNVTTRRIVATLKANDSFEAVAFSPDGSILATGNLFDYAVRLWKIT